ncbi:ShlB/FhaC/HecB family hemolysin secretion/activation protein [Polynucleobacter sp. Latsch14-2]|jgi:hemolysin activation/secretion protein|uniref:ShlB/FhaC/HecB family hemolysin secretion/activation protein n=1 Tax=Polynucleobacter sp. Latsch14-2 TaxID=2576920 RepID=UPI001C0B1717|nr:POTRA domain-containing protein [Polynucleobacter sp. Latsch14-2]MBU3614380.1 ShlB/FhaC/HecB family hemolysin secretion/activation protein [Polynucleobacter sp. Latsch14-2]
MSRLSQLLLSACIAFTLSGIARISLAQTSAGQVLQEIQQLAPPAIDVPQATREVSPLKPDLIPPKAGQVTFVVKQFVFTGNNKISNEELQSLVSGFLNKSITFDNLKQATDVISRFYQEKGWLVRAMLPQQDITGGTITIRIVEAKLGGIKIDNQSKRVSNQRVEDWVYGRIPKASELSLEELDRALLTLNDLPDVNVVGSIQEGTKPGEVNLLVTVTDKPLFNGQVAVDNYGSQGTGQVRGTAQINLNGPMGIGDQVSVYGLYTEGSTYGRLGYTAPVGDSGLRVGINGSSMNYRVINQSFSSLYANGTANTGGVEASYPIIRSRATNLIAVGYWNYSQFKNWTIAGLNTEQTYNTNVTQAGLTGNSLDNFFGGGLNVGSVILSGGNVNRNPLGVYNGYYGVAGDFAKVRYGLNRTQSITNSTSAYLAVSGQLATKNMDSSEQLYLGGPLGVRAYATGEGAASQGNLTTFELRQNLPYQTQLAAFYDIANVQTWKFNPAINTVSNNYVLQGYGLSLTWLGPYGSNLKAVWAQRTGALSQSTTNYLSQNGGNSQNRFWFMGSIPF